MNSSTRETTTKLPSLFRRGLLATGRNGGGLIGENDVLDAYRRWAPVYDNTFGRITTEGRRQAVAQINQRTGRVLEIGVGTGLSLSMYQRHLDIVGIDLSPDMLDKARSRVATEGLEHITGLHEMDAAKLDFPDGSFDTVVAMYVMTVVPDPVAAKREAARVCKIGGEVMLLNHFSEDAGVRGWVERRMAPFASRLGWHPVFDVERVMVCENLAETGRSTLKPLGLFTLLRFCKTEADTSGESAQAA